MAKKPKINYKKNKDKPEKKIKYNVKDTVADIQHPVFCFRYLVSKYDLTKCDAKDKVAFLTRLEKLSKLGFKEIDNSPRHGFGNEKIARTSLKIKLPKFITDDVDFVYAYRYSGKKPFIAYRRPFSPILHILGIDYNFTIYNH